MSLPTLTAEYLPTLTALHQVSMLIGPIQNAALAPQANYLHLPFWIHPLGFDSQTLPGAVEIHLDFYGEHPHARIVRPGEPVTHYDLPDHTQYSLFAALLADLRRDVLAEYLADAPADTLPEFLMTKLRADKSRTEFQSIEQVGHKDPLVINGQIAQDYMALLNTVFTAYARFRARLKGHLTPIVVWPEHFDLSTLWFAEGDFDDYKAQMNFGFAPFSGGLPYPYLYVTGYPYVDNIQAPALPEGAIWNSEGWTGIVVPYSELAKQVDLEQYVETTLRAIFPIMHSLIKLPTTS